jgi:hypothetical protein
MPVETSMYGQFQLPETPNLLSMAGQMGQVNNQMMQNQLLQNELEAQEALGGVVKAATDENGRVSYPKLLTGMSAHPKLAAQLPTYYKKMKEAELVDSQVMEQALKTTEKRSAVLGKVGQMILETPGVDRAKVVSIVAATIGRPDSGFTPGEGLNILLMAGENPEQITQQAQSLVAGALETKDFIDMNRNAIRVIDSGSTNDAIRTDPYSGAMSKVASFDKTMDPNKANEPVMYFDQNNNQRSARTGDPVFGPQIGAAQLRAQPVQEQPPVVRPVPMPTQPPPVVSPQPTVIPTNVGPALKPPVSMEMDKEITMDFEKELNKRGQTIAANKSTIDRAAELIPFASVGPGADLRRAVGEYAVASGVDDKLVNNMLGGDIAAMQELGKILLQQSVTNMVSTYGSYQQFSTQEFEAFKNNNPNLNTSEAALKYMVNKSQALIELQELEQEAYADWKKENANKPVPGAGFVPEFSKFAVKYMKQRAEESNYLPKKKE